MNASACLCVFICWRIEWTAARPIYWLLFRWFATPTSKPSWTSLMGFSMIVAVAGSPPSSGGTVIEGQFVRLLLSDNVSTDCNVGAFLIRGLGRNGSAALHAMFFQSRSVAKIEV